MAELPTQSSGYDRPWDLAAAYSLLFGYCSVRLTAEQLTEIERSLSEHALESPDMKTLALSKLTDAISRAQHRERSNG